MAMLSGSIGTSCVLPTKVSFGMEFNHPDGSWPKQLQYKLSTVVSTFNSSTPEPEAGGLQVQGQPGLNSDSHQE